MFCFGPEKVLFKDSGMASCLPFLKRVLTKPDHLYDCYAQKPLRRRMQWVGRDGKNESKKPALASGPGRLLPFRVK